MIHTFKEDLYGEILSVVMVGYIRPERSFDSLGKIYISVSLSGSVFTVECISSLNAVSALHVCPVSICDWISGLHFVCKEIHSSFLQGAGNFCVWRMI